MSRPFTDFLRDLRYGRSVEELSELVSKMVEAVTTTGKSGVLTVKLHFNPPKKGSINYIEVIDEVVCKVPEADKPSSIFFPTAGNDLTLEDPRQRELALGFVDTTTGEIRSAQ